MGNASQMFKAVDTSKHRAQLSEADTLKVAGIADRYRRDFTEAAEVLSGLTELACDRQFTQSVLRDAVSTLKRALDEEHDRVVGRVVDHFNDTYSLALSPYNCCQALEKSAAETLADDVAAWVLGQVDRPLGDVREENAVAAFSGYVKTGNVTLSTNKVRLKNFVYMENFSNDRLADTSIDKILKGVTLFETGRLEVITQLRNALPQPYSSEPVNFGELYATGFLARTAGVKIFKNGTVEFVFIGTTERDAFLSLFKLHTKL